MQKQTKTGGMTRRVFLGELLGAVAVANARWTVYAAEGAADAPKLRIGLLADLHLCAEDGDFGKFGDAAVFERALRWFDAQEVDGVVVAGDIADNGIYAQLKKAGEAWRRVFPGNRGSDGRPVEKLFVCGNHDVEGQHYDGFEKRFFDQESFRRDWVVSDLPRYWRQAFDEEYEPIWVKRIKGYPVVGAHWVPGKWDGTAGVEKFFADREGEFDRNRPLFFIQHPHPQGTCFGAEIWGHDAGYATRALARFPKAVAISGHSHSPATDDRFLWRGAFTSIGLGSMRYSSSSNVNTLVGKEIPIANPEYRCRWHIGQGVTRQGMLLTLGAGDAVTLTVMDFESMEKLREDVHFTLGEQEGADGFAARAARSAAPEWPDDARLEVKEGETTLAIAFPAANRRSRPMAYLVEGVKADGSVVRRAIVPPEFDRAAHYAPMRVEAQLPRDEFGTAASISVTAVHSLGKRSAPIVFQR